MRRKSKGSSILEMLIAIFVLGVVLISMIAMFLISRTAIYNKEDETANSIALRYLEQLEALPFNEIVAIPDTGMQQNFGKYRVTATVHDHDDDDERRYMAIVRVDVVWDAAVMGSKSLRLERTISAGGHRNVGEHQ
jgi:Tfp pilus assembly protein PilV